MTGGGQRAVLVKCIALIGNRQKQDAIWTQPAVPGFQGLDRICKVLDQVVGDDEIEIGASPIPKTETSTN